MRVVTVELRPLMLGHRILDGERVKLELLGDMRKVGFGRVAIVEPDTRVRLEEVIGDVDDGKVLEHELSVAVETRPCHRPKIGCVPDRERNDFYGSLARASSPPGGGERAVGERAGRVVVTA
jgi:hypothetical protein